MAARGVLESPAEAAEAAVAELAEDAEEDRLEEEERLRIQESLEQLRDLEVGHGSVARVQDLHLWPRFFFSIGRGRL